MRHGSNGAPTLASLIGAKLVIVLDEDGVVRWQSMDDVGLALDHLHAARVLVSAQLSDQVG